MRDASLDEFAGAGDDGEATDSDASNADNAADSVSADDPTDGSDGDDAGDASGGTSDGTSASGDQVVESTDEVDGMADGESADGESADGVDGVAEGTEASAGGGGGADARPAVDVDDVEEAHPTYVRDPDGGTCADCGEQVERRWTSEAGLVCPACKDW